MTIFNKKITKADKKWGEILERFTAKIQTLPEQSLFHRGHRESLVGDSYLEAFWHS
jgi:hypothetical protein